MLLYGNINSGKTEMLAKEYARLLNNNVHSDEILVIVQNSKLKEEFISLVKPMLTSESLSNLNVYSFFGLCYNTILENYPVAEEKINYPLSSLMPNLCGLEASQYLFSNAVKELEFKGYNSKTNLLHQLLRRQSLITLNALNDEEVKERTKILKESFTSEVSGAINLYKQKTLECRAFDYLRQIQMFSYLYKRIKNPYKYVFVDDADEIVPQLFEYLKYIKPDVKEFFIAYDPKGTSRKGHLCASENNFELFLNETPKILDEKNKKNETADLIFKNVKEQKETLLENFSEKSFVHSNEMFEQVVSEINELLNNGEKPSNITVLIPSSDNNLKHYLKKITSSVNFITGSEKIEDNKVVGLLIAVLKLLIEPDSYTISPYTLKGILGLIFKVDLNGAIKISQAYEANLGIKTLFEILSDFEDSGEIKKFLSLKERLENSSLGEALYILAENFVEKTTEVVQKINQLLKQINDFETIFSKTSDEYELKKTLLKQLENTIIAENPFENNVLKPNSVYVSTIQKAIDFKIRSKYLFILNATDSNWIKQDIGPLYNAWVFQKNRIKKDFTLEDNILLSNDKTARLLRKIYLLSDGEIRMFSCIYNFLGQENFKGIKHLFVQNITENKPAFKIVPRKDQAPVLEYKKGNFAVMAVAGAGKTTIMLALIMKLLEMNVKAENIFVLTFMDSAARTFRERIKACYPNLTELPNISTIHGLSMRILKENNNHALMGLDVDFEIIDELKRNKLITEIIYNEGLEGNLTSLYERAISAFKNSKKRNVEFLKPTFKRVFTQYQRALKNINMIDYDDLLFYALELLKQNSKIREYYQELVHYVIEDEAQDSSPIQQELITIISRKYGNVVRTGDVNQAITSTFTNSDTEGFKRFIRNNPSSTMNYSARNSTGIIELANKTIKRGLLISETSFLDIETKPVSGKNIVDYNSCHFQVFDKENDEREFIVDKMQQILKTDSKAKIGLLLRTNIQGEKWAQYLKTKLDCKITTNTGFLINNPVYRTVLALFNFIENPMNNSYILEFAKVMYSLGFYKNDIGIFEYIKTKPTPFILDKNEEYAIWWDLRYFLEFTVLSVEELAFLVGEFYFSNDKVQKKNIAPVASIVAKIFKTEGNFEETVAKMNSIANKSPSFNIKLIEDQKEETTESEIFVLTMHKSKGDEFDYVFMPEITDKNLCFNIDNIKIKENAKMVQTVQGINKSDSLLKREILDENLRLFYVAITRAKKELYITSAREYKVFNKLTKFKESECFNFSTGGESLC